MKACFIILPLLLLSPRAHAVIQINGDRGEVPPDLRPVSLDVFMVDLDGENNRLNRFQIKLQLIGGSPTGIFFSGFKPTSPNHPPIFPGVEFEDLGSDFDTLFVSAALPAGEGRDVEPRQNGLLAPTLSFGPDWYGQNVFVTIDGSDPDFYAFYNVDGERVQVVQGVPAGIIFIPEPFAASLLAPLGLFALRRPDRGGYSRSGRAG